MKSKMLALALALAPFIAGCTTVASPGPNARQELVCPEGEQEVCSGGTASRIEGLRDPFATCRCERPSDQHYEPLPERYR